MLYEWNAAKASANARKHGVSFEEASSVFLDPFAMTFADPDLRRRRSAKSPSDAAFEIAFCSSPIASEETARELSARARRPDESAFSMKKPKAAKATDELRPEYDLSELGRGVRGKYYGQAVSGSNLVLIEPDLCRIFPDSDSVNRALRLLVKTATATASPRRPPRPHKAGARERNSRATKPS